MSTQQQVPILILREGTSQTRGHDAQRNNIMAAKLVAEIVRSSLGPRGMDKMLVDTLGDVTITNDGATILKEMDVQHPAAKMMVEIAKTTDNEVGDGTTSSVVLAGALLEKAEDLINKEVHPTIIVDGYKKALTKTLELLRSVAIKVNPTDKDSLRKVATTSLVSKLVSGAAGKLSDVVVDAVLAVAEKTDGAYKVDIDDVKVERKAGGSLEDTVLIKGIALDKEVVHGEMPKKITKARIALVNAAFEIEKTEFDAKINISTPEQMKMFLDEENMMLKAMTDKVKESGATVVICQKGIDDMAQHYLAKAGIAAVRRVKESDMNKLAKATGGRVVTNIEELTGKDLGHADMVEERKVEADKWVFIEGCKDPKAVTLLIKGGSQRVVDEAERALHDALMVTKDVMEKPYILVGGGAPENYVSRKIREWANSLSGREQLAVQKFADALETIPLVLAENAGMNMLDTQVQLRAKNGGGNKGTWGVNVLKGKVEDLSKINVYDPLVVKEQVVSSATEAASMLLRIDDVIASTKSREPAGHGGAGGMGGMGGME